MTTPIRFSQIPLDSKVKPMTAIEYVLATSTNPILDSELPEETMKSVERTHERISHIRKKREKGLIITENDKEFIRRIRRWIPNDNPYNIFGRSQITAFEKSKFGYDIQVPPPFFSGLENPSQSGKPLSMFNGPYPSVVFPFAGQKKRTERLARILTPSSSLSPSKSKSRTPAYSLNYGKTTKKSTIIPSKRYVPLNK